jgi:hypothetical protein
MPKKCFVWELVWSHFFGLPMPTHLVYQAIHRLRFPRQQLVLLSGENIVKCIILEIWKAHRRFDFDNIPFDLLLVFQ